MTAAQRAGHARSTLDELPGMVRRRRDREHLTLRAAAEEIGIPHSILWRLEHGHRITTGTADAVLAWMETA